MTKAKSAAKAEDSRTLLVKTNRETFKITIPADWKVTFGPLSSAGYVAGNALRLYETENKQRAVFVDVHSFRDLSIPVTRLIKSKSGEESWEDDGQGNASSKRSVKTEIVEVEEA